MSTSRPDSSTGEAARSSATPTPESVQRKSQNNDSPQVKKERREKLEKSDKSHEKREKREKPEKLEKPEKSEKPEKPEKREKLYISDDKVVTITTKEDFEDILTEAGDKIIMVEFFATWCGPCRLLSVKLEELAILYRGKAIIVKIDIDDFEDLAAEYNVTSMPAFMIMKNKQKIEHFVGSKVEQLESALEKFVGKPGE